ncbi:MAG: FAD-dependent oxidoreductase [Candidatus Zapsychrus exili]|nr:FAD-dependent oxidoreductase [Candidatus Zapsychrus exili]
MQEFKCKFIGSVKRTDNVSSFRFSPESKISFIPGQFAQIIFDKENMQNKNVNKYLSFSCSPERDYIEFTKKLSDSEFSSRLKFLKEGDEILIKGPMGSCVLKEEYKKIGFLAGGIGITPAISIIEYILDKNLDIDVNLLYSNWTVKDIAFKEELDNWSKEKGLINISHCLVELPDNDMGYSKGMINEEFINKQMIDYKIRNLFIVGPPVMVEAMKKVCANLGCAEDMIKAENFMGY